MPIYQAILLAVVQGITEFLPISSSAHLALTPWLLGWKDQGLTFDIALHVGSLLAVVLYFWKDWMQIFAEAFGIPGIGSDDQLRRNPGLLWKLAAASLPIGVIGFLFKDAAETTFRSPFVMGVQLIWVGLFMWYADRHAKQTKDLAGMGYKESLAIGAAQAIAVIPGTSRSGITMSAGLLVGLDRMDVARFSFLLSTPAIFAAAALALKDLYKAGGIPPDERAAFASGVVASAITGAAVIGFLLKYLRNHSFTVFIAYRIVLGILVIALALFRR